MHPWATYTVLPDHRSVLNTLSVYGIANMGVFGDNARKRHSNSEFQDGNVMCR